MKTTRHAGFTLVELATATGVFAMISLGLLSVTSVTTRLMARNLTTNHSHEAVRTSGNRLLADLHDAASPFTLINFDGSTYSNVSPAASSDVDPLSTQTISQRANGVTFRKFAGGPYQIVTGAVAPAATSLTFNFSAGGGPTYAPQVGDKFILPVIKQIFEITAVTTAPTAGNPLGTVSFSPTQLGYAIDPTDANPMTGYFLRRVAYTVWQGQLRYHPNFTGGGLNTSIAVRQNITSPRPFSFLFATPTAPVADLENLHVSMEAYDTGFSARRFLSGTTTLQTVISARTQPIFISHTD